MPPARPHAAMANTHPPLIPMSVNCRKLEKEPAQAGPLALNDEARIILDPIPQYVVPATISFVAADAQFTPKSVETQEEREKLTFRIKLQIDPKVLKKYHQRVKTGVRGLGFVRIKPEVAWPDDLAVKLP